MTWVDFGGGILLFIALFVLGQILTKKHWNLKSFWPIPQSKQFMERWRKIFPEDANLEDRIHGRKDI